MLQQIDSNMLAALDYISVNLNSIIAERDRLRAQNEAIIAHNRKLHEQRDALRDAMRRIVEPAEQPSLTRFTVDVENNPRMRFDSADSALRYAVSKIYAGQDTLVNAEAALKAGTCAQWSYGFGSVTIYPPEQSDPKSIARSALATCQD